jgi:CRP-like cAMP-binding protein
VLVIVVHRWREKPVNCGCKFSSGKRVASLPDKLRPRILSGLTNAELDSLLSVARHVQFRKASVIQHEGDEADRFFLLTSGQGRQFVTTQDGQAIVLYWLTAGQLFGGSALLSARTQYLASTELLADSCALVWDRQTIRELMSRCPQLLDNAFSIAVTRHVSWFVASQVSLASDDARGRVARLLESLASGIGKAALHGIELEITNEELAAGANVTHYTASRILNEWQRSGVLTKHRGKILLRKPLLMATG